MAGEMRLQCAGTDDGGSKDWMMRKNEGMWRRWKRWGK